MLSLVLQSLKTVYLKSLRTIGARRVVTYAINELFVQLSIYQGDFDLILAAQRPYLDKYVNNNDYYIFNEFFNTRS